MVILNPTSEHLYVHTKTIVSELSSGWISLNDRSSQPSSSRYHSKNWLQNYTELVDITAYEKYNEDIRINIPSVPLLV